MLPRLLSLGLVLVLLVVGCLAGAPTGPATTDGPTTTDAPTSTEESPLMPKPLPDQPEHPTRENVVEFVREYEQAYKWNQVLADESVDIAVNPVRAEILNSTDAGFVVHLEVGFSHTFRSDGAKMVGDGFYTANYFINKTTIRRAEAGGQVRPGPDPRNGTTLEG